MQSGEASWRRKHQHWVLKRKQESLPVGKGWEGLACQRNTECARPQAGQQGLWDDPWWPTVRHLGGQVKATNWMWT